MNNSSIWFTFYDSKWTFSKSKINSCRKSLELSNGLVKARHAILVDSLRIRGLEVALPPSQIYYCRFCSMPTTLYNCIRFINSEPFDFSGQTCSSCSKLGNIYENGTSWILLPNGSSSNILVISRILIRVNTTSTSTLATGLVKHHVIDNRLGQQLLLVCSLFLPSEK